MYVWLAIVHVYFCISFDVLNQHNTCMIAWNHCLKMSIRSES